MPKSITIKQIKIELIEQSFSTCSELLHVHHLPYSSALKGAVKHNVNLLCGERYITVAI